MSSLSHHGIKGQKWGVRRYQNKDGTRTALGKHRDFERTASKVVEDLSNSPQPFIKRPLNKDKIRQRGLITQAEADQCASLATGVFKQASQAEPQITGDVIDVVSSTSAKMYGLNNRLKQPTSIAAKIGADAKSDGVTFEQAANGLKDVIRYTAVSDSRDYVDTYNAIKQRLEKKGYTETKCKNYFQKYQNGEVIHKAVQSTFRSPDGVDFEFQFQTPESQAAKELKVPIYNERRKAGNTPERNAELEREMRNLAEQVPDPEGVFGIKSHSGVTNSNKLKHTSIGGTMYIEGNALILCDSSYLEHHGVKGQRWGIRRFQNEDGSLTPLGEKRIKKLKKIGDKHNKQQALLYGQSNLYSAKSIQPIFGKFKNLDSETEVLKAGAKINRIATENEPLDDKRKYVSFTSGDNAKYKFFAEVKELGLPKDAEPYAYQFRAIKDIRIANGKAIESFIVNDIKATSTSKKQKEEAKKIIEAFDKHLDNEAIIQGASKVLEKAMSVKEGSDNHFYKEAGIKANDQIDLYRNTIKTYIEGDPKKVEKLADHLRSRGYDAYLDMVDARSSVRWKYGTDYPLIMMSPKDNMELVKSEKLKHTSIGGTMYIEGNALILGDSSYLEHHGIKGQRWGIRRFQNRDGSLTNAGRKRLGYATKGATQAVKKAFKAGVKTGAKAVKAAKAHHEKAEAKKIEKKKEKASKTRLGVMANKDLFTNEEIRKLNERFKLEDEMKMATLQKGVEIAKAVGTIAQNVGTVAKTYEDVTGQSLSPIKRKAAEEKARQDKEDRDRRIAREDADEARKAAKEERDIAIHEQTLRKAIAAADTQEFTAQKTKAEADSSVLDAIKKGQDFNGGGDAKTDATGKSWIEKATSGGDNPFDKMIYDRDPDYKAAKDAHDEKAEWDQHVKERDARIAARERGMQPEDESSGKQKPQQPQAKSQPQSQPQQKKSDDDDDDRGGFAKLKEALPFDKGRYVNRKAAEKAKDVKESAEEERTKKQDEKAAKAAIDTIIKDYQHQDDTARSINPTKYDREVAASVIKGKAKNALNKVTHPVDTVAKKISDKAREEKWTKERAKLFEEYQDNREKLGTEFANEAYVRAKKQSLQNLGYRGEALDKKLNETPFSKKKKAKHDAFSIQNGVLFVDSSDGLAHHGIRGQRWGVRRFQNADGTRTEAGKKHDAKLAAKAEKKQAKIAAKDAKRSAKAEKIRAKAVERYERKAALSRRESEAEAYKLVARDTKKASQKELLSDQKVSTTIAVGQGILGAIGLATYGVPTVAAIAGGAAIVGIMRNYNLETVRTSKTLNNLKGAEKERLAKSRATDQIMDDWREEGLGVRHFSIQNGTLFINAGEPYLEHHGVKGMKWGKHLMAGKGVDAEGGGGGGFAEDDEKLKEMAKKAGMSVAEYRTKMASKIGGAASKVGSAVYDAAGGSHKKNAEGWRKMAQEESNAARASERSSHENSARAASQDRKYGSGGDVYRRAADSDKENAKTHHSNAKARSERAASEQAAYEKSLAGKYDKMKADRARKKSAKEKHQLMTHATAEAKKVSVKDRHLVINGTRSSANAGTRSGYQILPEDHSGAARPKAERKKITRKAVGEALYNIAGGNAKKAAQEHHRNMVNYKNEADKYSRDANIEGSAAKAHKRAGNVSAYVGAKTGARVDEENAKNYRLAQYSEAEEANKAQRKYDRSLAGLYDKATGKYKQVHKQTKTPSLSKQYQYYMKDVNGKLFDHGNPKTAKERAKAEVWNAADYRIKAQDYYNQSFDPTVTAYGYDTAYRKAAVDQGRLAEGAYRRAAALGKQASRETSTSSRPRARKKKHTSGGSGVTVRRPGRKPVSRTKRVTQSSTGVKRRGATGSGRRVR